MKLSVSPLVLMATIACLCTFRLDAVAQTSEQTETARAPAPTESVQVEADPAATAEARDAADDDGDEDAEDEDFDSFPHRRGDVIVHFSNDARLAANKTAKAVVAIFGAATADGDVDQSIVSVFGDMRLNGRVGEDAAAVFGNAYVNGKVDHDVVAVFGDVRLGPDAVVGHEVVAVGGNIIRDPGAVVHGSTSEIYLGGFGHLEGLKIWVRKCLLYGRPLAFEPGLGWAWALALGTLALYIGLALLFPVGVEKCVATLERQPGQWILASILTVLLTPVLILVLLISLIGIGFIPFLGIGLFCAALFGKAVVLAALGRRVTRFTGIGAFSHIAFAVLIGGIVVLGLYVVPVLGLVVQQLTGILGVGVVIYTFVLFLKARRDSSAATRAATASASATTAGAAAIDPATAPSAQGSVNTDVPPTADSGVGISATPATPATPTTPTTDATDATDATTMPRAGFMIRMGALLIDAVLLGVALSFLEPGNEFFLIVLAAYGAAMWKLKGTTIGGIVCNLRVVRLDGREINWDTSIVRALGCFLSLAFAGLGFLWIIFDEGRQSWHDKIAGTAVVRSKVGPLL
jgi:uncharacterized RDD family membrane protein YckC